MSRYLIGRKRFLGVGIAMMMLVAACTGTPQASPSQGAQGGTIDSLVVQIAALGTEAIDPNLGQLDDKPYTRLIYSYLFDTDLGDVKLSDAGGVAESYSWSADKKALTVNLRKGVKFHNGEELKAADVKFSIARNTDKSSLSVNAKAVGDLITSIDIVNDYQLVINAPRPSVTLIPLLSPYVGGTEGMIYPKAYFEQVGEAGFRQKPVGSGPYKLESRQVGSNMVFTAFKEYFLGAPKVDRMRFEIVPEKSTRVANLQAGQADIVEVLRTDSADLKGKGFNTFADEGGDAIILVPITWTDLRPSNPLTDGRVREALLTSINREDINKFLLNGIGKLSGSWIGEQAAVGGAPIAPYKYDPARARQLLSEAGLKPDELTINLQVALKPSYPEAKDIAVAIAADWKAIGVKTNVVAEDFGTLLPRLTARTVEQPSIFFNSVGLRALWGAVMGLYFNCPVARYGNCDQQVWTKIQSLDQAKDLEEYGRIQQDIAVDLHNRHMQDVIAYVGRVFATSKKVQDWKLGLTAFDLNFRYIALKGLLN
jgi:peptide/nickel transport system substrate-binding protein